MPPGSPLSGVRRGAGGCCQENRTAAVFVEDTWRSFHFHPGPQHLWEASFENLEADAVEGVLADGIYKDKSTENRVNSL